MTVKDKPVIRLDIQMLRVSDEKLSLTQSGHLIRALMSAKVSKRPTREQKILLALYTKDGEGAL